MRAHLTVHSVHILYDNAKCSGDRATLHPITLHWCPRTMQCTELHKLHYTALLALQLHYTALNCCSCIALLYIARCSVLSQCQLGGAFLAGGTLDGFTASVFRQSNEQIDRLEPVCTSARLFRMCVLASTRETLNSGHLRCCPGGQGLSLGSHSRKRLVHKQF